MNKNDQDALTKAFGALAVICLAWALVDMGLDGTLDNFLHFYFDCIWGGNC